MCDRVQVTLKGTMLSKVHGQANCKEFPFRACDNVSVTTITLPLAIFEPSCTYAWWNLRSCFPSVWVCGTYVFGREQRCAPSTCHGAQGGPNFFFFFFFLNQESVLLFLFSFVVQSEHAGNLVCHKNIKQMVPTCMVATIWISELHCAPPKRRRRHT